MSGKALWVPLDVNFLWDESILSCGLEAQLLFIRGLCMAKQTGSNGFISRMQVAQLCFDMDDRGDTAVKELIEANLWVDDAERYQIRSWTKHNRTVEETSELSKIRAEAGRKGGQAKRKQVASLDPKQSKAEEEGKGEKKQGEANALARPIPADWTITPEMFQWAKDELPPCDVVAVSKKFMDHYRANGEKRSDWFSAWKLWMRREESFK